MTEPPMGSGDGAVTIGAGPLVLADLVRVARVARLELDGAARARIEASRAVVNAAVD